MFFMQLYIQWQYKYLHDHKKMLNEKKNCQYVFNKKNPLYAGIGSKQKTFSNYQTTYQKELCLLFKNQAIFSSERTCRHAWPVPPLLICFSLLFKVSLNDKRTFWMGSSFILLKKFKFEKHNFRRQMCVFSKQFE